MENTMRASLWAALVALILSATATAGWYVRDLRADLVVARADAEVAKESLKRLQATSTQRAKSRVRTDKSSAVTEKRVQAALDKAPEWRDQPVPQEVQDALAETGP